jgi:branched-chain amino acid transport system permease protein
MALIDVFVLVGVLTAIYLVMSIGLGIQWGDTGIMNFGLAGFFGIGGYTSAILTTPATPGAIAERTVGFDIPVVAGIVAAFLVTAVIGGAVALSSIRVRGDFLAIVLLAFDRIVERIISTEAWLTSGVRGIDGVPKVFDATGSTADLLYLLFALGVAAAAYVAMTRLSGSSFGRVLHAIREDEEATQALAKDTRVYKVKAFAIGSGLAGVSGALMAHYLGIFAPTVFPITLTFLIWTAIVVGGSGSYRGVIAGTVVIMALYQAVRFVPNDIPFATYLPEIRLITIGVMLIVIMYARPYGLLGDKDRMEAGGVTL